MFNSPWQLFGCSYVHVPFCEVSDLDIVVFITFLAGREV